uniref:Putative salivary lipocalin n=1 Tax=Ixodes ricinus TaxID=34613 RepID=A0A0K8R559_IXORI
MHFRKAVRVRCALLEYYAVYPKPSQARRWLLLVCPFLPVFSFLNFVSCLPIMFNFQQLAGTLTIFFALKALAGFDTVNSHSRKHGSCVVMYEKQCL